MSASLRVCEVFQFYLEMSTKCGHCSGNVNRTTNRGIPCLACEKYFHRTCTFLKDEFFEVFLKTDTAMWVCEKCKPELSSIRVKNLKLIAENTDLTKANADLQSRLSVLESKFGH